MVWGIAAAAGIGALGSIFSANEQSDAASDAADAQTQAANQSLAFQQDVYDDQRALFQPYYQMGLQGMYGASGLGNLLGVTQPGTATAAQTTAAQPQNAFSQYASGTYGATSPAEQQTNQYQSYVQQSPDLMSAYQGLSAKDIQDIASTQYDADGNGRISVEEFGQFHYDRHGASEGRQLPSAQPQNAFAASSTPAVVDNGNGTYGVGADQAQITAGTPATTTSGEGAMTDTLRQTPGYQFLQDESKRNLENSFASRGELLSGSALSALNEQTLGLADQTYQNSVNNQFQLANLGLGAAAQTSNAGTNFANASSNAYTNIGNAQANSAIGQANAFSSGLQGLGNSAAWGIGAAQQGGYFGGNQNQAFTFNQNGGNNTGWVSN